MEYSVLMSVYHKENPQYFRESIESMLKQTISPDEIVIVKDGKLTDGLDEVINYYCSTMPGLFTIVQLEENVGLGRALNEGIKVCKNELVARMDTDDISIETRCEKQLLRFSENKNLSVIGTGVSEFICDYKNVVAYKEVKENDKDIKTQMKYRNPFNHPSVMFKKKDVLKSGNYLHCPFNEDYYLWIRMMQQNCIFENIDEPLVKMRITKDTYLRRSGIRYFIAQKHLFNYMLKYRTINIFEYMFNIIIRFTASVLMPNILRRIFYLKILRSIPVVK